MLLNLASQTLIGHPHVWVLIVTTRRVGTPVNSAMPVLTEVREERNPSLGPVYAMLRPGFSVTGRMFSEGMTGECRHY